MWCRSQLSTPEGADTVSIRLVVVVDVTIVEIHVPSVSSIVLCTTPVVSGGEWGQTSIHKFSFRKKCSKINLELLPL